MVAAALSPSLNSMASTTVRDFYLPYFRKDATEAQQMRVGRAFTVIWGIAQILVAVAAQNMDSALQGGLAALSYASGPTVGAFLLGVAHAPGDVNGDDDRNDRGLATSLAVGMLAPYVFHTQGVAWTWNVAMGATATFAVAMILSTIRPRQAERAPA